MSEAIQCGGIRVVFVRQADRFAHRIEVQHDGRFVTVYESFEGSDEDLWPASPPFQSLHFREAPDGRRVALLVGMAGRSHWSGSVEAEPTSNRIVFDVACRVQQEPVWLGNSYRILDESLLREGEAKTPLPLGEGRSALATRRGEVRVLAEPISISEDTSPQVAEAAIQVRQTGAELSIAATLIAGPLPRTIRWRYAVILIERAH